MTRVDQHLFGPWAIVTGASSGIGKEFARQLAASGLNLVLVARRLPVLKKVGSALEAQFGVRCRAVAVDLTKPDFVHQLEAATRDIDVGLLVSNAGAVKVGEFLGFQWATVEEGVRLNVLAHLSLVWHFGPALAKRGRGGILLVSSASATHGAPFMADYAAAKAYILRLGEALHLEFKRKGLRLTVLLPGPTATEGVDALGIDVPVKHMPVEQTVAEGLAALQANRATCISGRMNRLMARLIPARVMRRLMATLLSRALANRGHSAAV